jgi:hypothetical protein
VSLTGFADGAAVNWDAACGAAACCAIPASGNTPISRTTPKMRFILVPSGKPGEQRFAERFAFDQISMTASYACRLTAGNS